MKRYVCSILLILWLCVISFFSGQNGVDSKKLTTTSIDKVVTVTSHTSHKEKKDTIIQKWIKPVRKGAHTLEYLILGILTYLVLETFPIKNKKLFWISFLCCVLYASIDEFHQSFVPGRLCSIWDVCIDSFGSMIGIIIIRIILKKEGVCYEDIG